MILGVHHAALAVPDMEKALDFYCRVMGFEQVMEAEIPSGFQQMSDAFGVADAACSVRMVRKGNSCIELFQFVNSTEGTPRRPVNRRGLTHFALSTDDFQKDYDHLASNGVKFHSEPVGAEPSRFVYGRDPFDNVIELLEHSGEGATALRYDD